VSAANQVRHNEAVRKDGCKAAIKEKWREKQSGLNFEK
jgi:hypothetical protein